MIYNQDLNISDKYKDTYQNIIKEFPDLKKRIRIEVSKRIRRKTMGISTFAKFDIFSLYFPRFKRYLLDNLLNIEDLEIFYKKRLKN